ncbi:MAG: M20/M25/M40 family metallo-hydrolase [Bacillota bacterium]
MMELLTQYPQIAGAREYFQGRTEAILDLVTTICQIPAPGFQEKQRAEFVADQMRGLGLVDVRVDDAYNAIGTLKGKGQGPTVMLAAHIDTVFPAGTNLTVRREGDKLHAPGIRDNSMGVTSLLALLQALKDLKIELPGDLICVGTSGEEGLGDLRGMKAAVATFKDQLDYCIAIDGGLGGLVTGGITSRRLEVTVQTGGGHSWGAFGVPSAIHSMGKMIAAIADLTVPTTPRTTFNVGVISGGTSINTIAAEAKMLIDMRSLQREPLMELEGQVREIIDRVCVETKVNAEIKLVGDRPGGSTSETHPLVQTVQAVQSSLGISTDTHASSTDANVPMGYGIPAVCLGTSHGANAHRVDEWLETRDIDLGMTQLLMVVCAVENLK